MCKSRPCRCSVDLVRTHEDHFWYSGNLVPGTFNFGWVQGPHPTRYRYLWVVLPCEGGELHGLPLRSKDSDPPKDRASWEWDGNEERPTLKPSVLTWRRKDYAKPDTPDNRQEVWHGFVTAGRAVSC